MIKKEDQQVCNFWETKKSTKTEKIKTFWITFYDYFFVTLPTGKYQYNVKTLIYRYLYNPYN